MSVASSSRQDLHLRAADRATGSGIESSVNVKFKRRSLSGAARRRAKRRDRYPNTLKRSKRICWEAGQGFLVADTREREKGIASSIN